MSSLRDSFVSGCLRCSVVLAVLVAACGGVSANPPGGGNGGSSSGGGGSGSSSGGGGSGSSGGGSSSGGGNGSSSGGGGASCPSTAPANFSTCSGSLSCEYGSDPNIQCDALAVCENGHWATTSPPKNSLCPTSAPGQNGCPSSYAAVPVGQGCSGEIECGYSQGRCGCTVALSGPAQIDAGARWECEAPQAGCPEPRPRAGTACTAEGQSCDYGGCTLPGGTNMVCTNGAWTQGPTACPLSAGGQ
jgi:hypothetical protein